MLDLNTVHEGDCLELMPMIPTGSIDLILCDLPYGTTACAWDCVIPLDPLWSEYRRIIKPNGAIVLTAQQPFSTVLAASNLKMLRYEWVWEKTMATGHLNSKRMPLKAHEQVLVFYSRLPTYNPQKTYGHSNLHVTRSTVRKDGVYGSADRTADYTVTDGSRYPRSVLTFPHDNRRGGAHPTAKPVALMEYMIRTYSNPGEVVLDNCLGSGTTAVAAINTDRKWIGIELDPTYAAQARERIAAADEAK